MRVRAWHLVLALLASCVPEAAYEPTTTTAAVIRPRAAPRPSVPRAAAPTEFQRPRPETSTAAATATVLGAELALPALVLAPPTPETATLARVLPPVGASSELPGTLQVIGTLQSLGGIPTRAPGLAGPMPRGFPLWWVFPFFPFGLSKAGGP